MGRALTAQWLPGRPDIHRVIEEQGKKDGRIGGQNAWPVDMLQPGDVYVCDHFGLKEDGPSIGDNVGNAIYAKSGNGIVYDGAVRDINGLKELENFTSFVRFLRPVAPPQQPHGGRPDELDHDRDQHPHPHRARQRCCPATWFSAGTAACMFIPPQLAEQVVQYSEITHLRDLFGHQRLREKKYTAGQIDNLALGVGSNRGKAPVYGPAFSTSLLDDVEAPQQGHAVTVDVKDATAGLTRAGVAFSVVSFTELQRDSIPALRHGHSVGKMSPTLARVERHVRCD